MKNSDLKNGMAVVCEDGDVGLVIENVAFNEGFYRGTIIKFKRSFNYIGGWNEELKCRYTSGRDICKVYNFTSWSCDLNDMDKYLDREQLLWERKQEIDWTKVPRGAKIKVRDNETSNWNERRIIVCLDEEYVCRFICESGYIKKEVCAWKYATIDNPKQEWLK